MKKRSFRFYCLYVIIFSFMTVLVFSNPPTSSASLQPSAPEYDEIMAAQAAQAERAERAEPYPVVLVHGLNSSHKDMDNVKKRLEKEIPGIYVKNVVIDLGEGEVETTYRCLWDQEQKLWDEIKKDERLKKGFNIIGYSLGARTALTLATRRASTRYPDYSINNVILWGGPLRGVCGIPHKKGEGDCLLEDVAYLFLYNKSLQYSLSIAELWNDPRPLSDYKNSNFYLPIINNEVDHPWNEIFKKNIIERVNKIVLFMSSNDDVIIPRESSWFAYYAEGYLNGPIVYKENNKDYNEDRLGLKTKFKRNQLHSIEVFCKHEDYAKDDYVLEQTLLFLKTPAPDNSSYNKYRGIIQKDEEDSFSKDMSEEKDISEEKDTKSFQVFLTNYANKKEKESIRLKLSEKNRSKLEKADDKRATASTLRKVLSLDSKNIGDKLFGARHLEKCAKELEDEVNDSIKDDYLKILNDPLTRAFLGNKEGRCNTIPGSISVDSYDDAGDIENLQKYKLDDGSLAVGGLENVHYLSYNVNNLESGYYYFKLKASAGPLETVGDDNRFLTIKIFSNNDGNLEKLKSIKITIPYTESWSTFKYSLSKDFNLPKGQYKLVFFTERGGFNINKLDLSSKVQSVPGSISVDSYDDVGDIENLQKYELDDGSLTVGGLENVHYLSYDVNNLESGYYYFKLKASAGPLEIVGNDNRFLTIKIFSNNDGNLEKLKSIKITIPYTESWSTFKDSLSKDFNLPKGQYKLVFFTEQGGFNINKLDLFSVVQSVPGKILKGLYDKAVNGGIPEEGLLEDDITEFKNLHLINYLDYHINVSEKGYYSVGFKATSQDGEESLMLSFFTKQNTHQFTEPVMEQETRVTIPRTVDWKVKNSVIAFSDPIYLTKGRHTMRITPGEAGFNLSEISVMSMGRPDKNEEGKNQYEFDPTNEWELVWSDEFNGNTLSDENWLINDNKNSINRELQKYVETVNGPNDNIRLENGKLIIEAQYNNKYFNDKQGTGLDYTSGRIETKKRHSFRYGRFEARIKLPEGVGTWPAFWIAGDIIDKELDEERAKGTTRKEIFEKIKNEEIRYFWPECGEIDVLEAFNFKDDNYNYVVQGALQRGLKGGNWSDFERETLKNIRADYHVFAVEWNENEVKWFVDDKIFMKKEGLSIRDYSRDIRYFPFGKYFKDEKYFMILNLAIGGHVYPNNIFLPESHFPLQMKVDYVRYYKKTERNDINQYDDIIPIPPPTVDEDNMDESNIKAVI